jgi:hypothetical protein
MKNRTFLIILGINFILLFNIGITYVHGQQSNLGTMNDTTTKVSETYYRLYCILHSN